MEGDEAKLKSWLILTNVRKPAKKTQITYECNLSFRQLKDYLRFIGRRDLVRTNVEERTVTYEITDDGRSFLDSYDEMARLLQTQKLKLGHFGQTHNASAVLKIRTERDESTRQRVRNEEEKLLFENC
jgi:predicted transcriptional regulator